MSKNKRQSFNKARQMVLDGWQNILTGLGITGVSKNKSSKAVWEPLTEIDADELNASSDVASTIVSDLPEEAFREGYDVCFTDKDEELTVKIEEYNNKLGVTEKFQTAWEWARLYGGAGIILIPKDMATETPLDENNLNDVTSLIVGSRYELQYSSLDNDVRSPNFGLPKFYNFTPRSGGTSIVVHHSRVIRFEGAKLTRRQFVRNNYWDDSVLTKCQDAIRNYEIAHESAANTVQDFSVAVHKIKGLGDIMKSEDGDTKVIKRMQIVNATRSIARTVVVDTDAEDFGYQQRTITGLPELINTISNRLVAASKMPHTKLLGDSPSGLGATGDSEQTNWYDFVSSKQENYLKPKLLRFYTLLFKTKEGPTGGQVPDGLNIEFRPLFQLTEKEEADLRWSNAQADEKYIINGVLDPKEIRDSRWGSGSYSSDIKIEMPEETELPSRDVTNINPALPAPISSEPDLQATALNGAQVTSLLGLVSAYKAKTIDKAGAIAFITASFPTINSTKANEILGEQTGVEIPAPGTNNNAN